MSTGRLWRPILAAAAAALAVAGLGALMTDLGPWYQNLQKPPWQPPDWLFGPVWTLIFGLAALSGVLLWRTNPGRGVLLWVIVLFGLNAVLNISWSVLFFRLHRPDWALLEGVLLWLSVAALMFVLAPHSRLASWLLAPYLLWVTFAGALNFTVVELNRPFAGT